MTTMYLAGPIDLVGADGQVWKKHLLNSLSRHSAITGQLTSFDPAGPYGLFNDFVHGDARSQYIEQVNEAALRASDIFVGLFLHDKASIGTPIELDLAVRRGKRIFVLADFAYTKSVYLRNRVNEKQFISLSSALPLSPMQPEKLWLEAWMDHAAAVITSDLAEVTQNIAAANDIKKALLDSPDESGPFKAPARGSLR